MSDPIFRRSIGQWRNWLVRRQTLKMYSYCVRCTSHSHRHEWREACGAARQVADSYFRKLRNILSSEIRWSTWMKIFTSLLASAALTQHVCLVTLMLSMKTLQLQPLRACRPHDRTRLSPCFRNAVSEPVIAREEALWCTLLSDEITPDHVGE